MFSQNVKDEGTRPPIFGVDRSACYSKGANQTEVQRYFISR